MRDRGVGTGKDGIIGGVTHTEEKEGNRVDLRRIGGSVVLVSTSAGAVEFGISLKAFRKALRTMKVPVVSIEGVDYFSLFTLEQVFFEALRPGRESWVLGEAPPGLEGDKCSRISHWYEIGLANLTYSGTSHRLLKQRVQNIARSLYRRAVGGRRGGRVC